MLSVCVKSCNPLFTHFHFINIDFFQCCTLSSLWMTIHELSGAKSILLCLCFWLKSPIQWTHLTHSFSFHGNAYSTMWSAEVKFSFSILLKAVYLNLELIFSNKHDFTNAIQFVGLPLLKKNINFFLSKNLHLNFF